VSADAIPTFAYVLVQRNGDRLKIGHSREPLGRASNIHEEWQEYFDTDISFAIKADSVKRARWIELGLQLLAKDYHAKSPYPQIRWGAGGHTEWYYVECLELLRQEVDRLAGSEGIVEVIKSFSTLIPEGWGTLDYAARMYIEGLSEEDRERFFKGLERMEMEKCRRLQKI
jgi:hypothetical protein